MRYTRDQTECLNTVLRKRYVCRCIAFNVAFLKQCLEFGVCPGTIQKRVQRAKEYQSLSIERTFIKDDIARSTDTLDKSRTSFKHLCREAREFLSQHDFLRFSILLSENDDRLHTRLVTKYDQNIKWLRKKRVGAITIDTNTIINLANIPLTTVQQELLSRGRDFVIPPTSNMKEQVHCDFELF